MGSGGGGGGSSVPAFDKAIAEEAVAEAYKRQQESRAALEAKTEPYAAKTREEQERLSTLLTGRTSPEAFRAYEENFARSMPALTREYESKVTNFKPGLLDTSRPDSSFNLLADVLRGSAREYGTAMDQASTRAGSRLQQALAAPIQGYEEASRSLAFNKLRDPVFMSYAERPPTVSSNVEDMLKGGLMTYNV